MANNALTPDDRIARVARRQHTVFSREQAFAAGFTSSGIGRRIASGAWIVLAPGVYALRGGVLTTERQYMAAQLSVAGAAIAGRAAGAQHRFEGFPVVRPTIVVPMGSTSRSRLADVRRALVVPTVVVVRGIRTTTIAQTLLDVSGEVDPFLVERAMDDALLTGRVREPQLVERLAAYKGTRRHGLASYRALVSERTADGFVPTESQLEQHLLRLLLEVFPPEEIVLQAQFSWRTVLRLRVDAYLPAYAALAEGDGRRWHARMQTLEADANRRNEAILAGLRPFTFTWRMLTSGRATALDQLARLRDGLRRAS